MGKCFLSIYGQVISLHSLPSSLPHLSLMGKMLHSLPGLCSDLRWSLDGKRHNHYIYAPYCFVSTVLVSIYSY